MTYSPSPARYDAMQYRRSRPQRAQAAGDLARAVAQFRPRHRSPSARADILFTAFDLGITHFDLANNYGPPPGSAEEFFGTVMQSDFRPFRDEMIISSKAGWDMWPGPYGDGGSRKYLLASLDQSLKRMKLDYVDIFYSHRFDPDTPLEETMGALDTAVRQGKALYVGISSYTNKQTAEAAAILQAARHAGADPSAELLHVQPLDRARPPARPAGDRGHGLHRLFAACSRACSPTAISTASRPTAAPPAAAS